MEWTQNGKVGEANYKLGTDFGVANQVKNFGGYSTAVTGSDFTFLLRALKDEGRLEVLSRPQIVTGDNKPGTINVGQRVPTITGSTVSTAGTTVNTYGYEDVGIILSVTPKISPDGFVKMEIGTTNSAISSAVVEINADAKIPILNQRRANTTVTVQSGQSILIGGLIATTDDKRVKKMPLLGDIPWIGSLFRSTKTARDRKELLILLTPQVLVNEPNLAISRTMSPHEMTREHLDKSRIKDEIKRDALQQQLLDPLFPPVKKDKASGSETDAKAIQKNEP
jgi:general secretion pathway protein D